MRSDIVPGGTFPNYELPDHTGNVRKLSELQGDDPLILTLARGHYCPKEHQQHLELAAFYPKIAVAYTQIAPIATDAHQCARTQTGPSDLQHLQRLLVLGSSLGRRSLARSARRDE